MRRAVALAGALLVASGIAVAIAAAVSYFEILGSSWMPQALLAASGAHTAFGCLAFPAFHAKRAVVALGVFSTLMLSTTTLALLGVTTHFASHTASLYVQNHWARLQNVATPFDTVHDEQEAVVSSLHGLFITTMCAVATSALAGCLLWWSLSVRFWRRAVTATLAVCGIGAAVAVLIILGDAIPGAVILMGHPWIIGASYTATVASLAVLGVVLVLPTLLKRAHLVNVFRVLAPIYAASTVLLLASGPAALAARGDRIQGATYARKHWHTLRLLLPPAYEAVGPEDASARADYVMRTTAMFILVLGALGIVITALLALQARGVRSMDPYVPFPVWMRMLRAARRKGRPWQFGRSSRAAIAGRPGRRHHTLSEDSGYFSDQTDDSSVVDSESVWSGDRTTTPGDGIVSGLRDESRPFASPDRGAGPRAPRHYGTLAGAAGRGKPTLEFGEAHEKLFPASEASTPLTTDTPREYITYREPNRRLSVLVESAASACQGRGWYITLAAGLFFLLACLAACGISGAAAAARCACADLDGRVAHNVSSSFKLGGGPPVLNVTLLAQHAHTYLHHHDSATWTITVEVSSRDPGVLVKDPISRFVTVKGGAIVIDVDQWAGPRNVLGADVRCAATAVEVRMPSTFSLELNSRSGEGAVDMTGLGIRETPFLPLKNLRITTGNGAVRVSDFMAAQATQLRTKGGSVSISNGLSKSVEVTASGTGRIEAQNIASLSLVTSASGPLSLTSADGDVTMGGLFLADNLTTEATGSGDLVMSNVGLVVTTSATTRARNGGSIFFHYVDTLAGPRHHIEAAVGGAISLAVFYTNRATLVATETAVETTKGLSNTGTGISVAEAFLGVPPQAGGHYPAPGLHVRAAGTDPVQLLGVGGANSTYSGELELNFQVDDGDMRIELNEGSYDGSYDLRSRSGTVYAAISGDEQSGSNTQAATGVVGSGNSTLLARSGSGSIELSALRLPGKHILGDGVPSPRSSLAEAKSERPWRFFSATELQTQCPDLARFSSGPASGTKPVCGLRAPAGTGSAPVS